MARDLPLKKFKMKERKSNRNMDKNRAQVGRQVRGKRTSVRKIEQVRFHLPPESVDGFVSWLHLVEKREDEYANAFCGLFSLCVTKI